MKIKLVIIYAKEEEEVDEEGTVSKPLARERAVGLL